MENTLKIDINTALPRVVERRLEYDIAGEQEGKLIVIDPRQTERQYLGTLVHEVLHHCFPDLEEEQVVKLEYVFAETLWRAKYRRVKGLTEPQKNERI